jgi:hypothetical protein
MFKENIFCSQRFKHEHGVLSILLSVPCTNNGSAVPCTNNGAAVLFFFFTPSVFKLYLLLTFYGTIRLIQNFEFNVPVAASRSVKCISTSLAVVVFNNGHNSLFYGRTIHTPHIFREILLSRITTSIVGAPVGSRYVAFYRRD